MLSIPLRSGRTVMAVSFILSTIHDFLEAPEEFETELKTTDCILEASGFVASLMDNVPPLDSIIVDGHLRATKEVCCRLFLLSQFVRLYLLNNDPEANAALNALGRLIYKHLTDQ
jgi:hypothetical protein